VRIEDGRENRGALSAEKNLPNGCTTEWHGMAFVKETITLPNDAEAVWSSGSSGYEEARLTRGGSPRRSAGL
jgi:hypothetical protein